MSSKIGLFFRKDQAFFSELGLFFLKKQFNNTKFHWASVFVGVEMSYPVFPASRWTGCIHPTHMIHAAITQNCLQLFWRQNLSSADKFGQVSAQIFTELGSRRVHRGAAAQIVPNRGGRALQGGPSLHRGPSFCTGSGPVKTPWDLSEQELKEKWGLLWVF